MEFGGLNTMLIAKSIDYIERENFNMLLSELIESFDARLAFTHANEIRLFSFILYYISVFLSEEGNTVGLSYAALQAVTQQVNDTLNNGTSESNDVNCLSSLLITVLSFLQAW